jgi:hypothetical protein
MQQKEHFINKKKRFLPIYMVPHLTKFYKHTSSKIEKLKVMHLMNQRHRLQNRTMMEHRDNSSKIVLMKAHGHIQLLEIRKIWWVFTSIPQDRKWKHLMLQESHKLKELLYLYLKKRWSLTKNTNM